MSEEKPGGLLLVMMEIDPEHEEEFNRWYWEDHIPERMALDGFRSARRFRAVEGKPKYLALYEMDGPDVLQSPAYREIYENPTEWTQRMRKLYKATRNVYVEIHKPERDAG